MTLSYLPAGAMNPPPVGHIMDGWLDADNLVTTDGPFIEEAAALVDEHAVGRLCQEAFDLGVAVRRFAAPKAELLSLEEQIERFRDDVASATASAVATVTTEISKLVHPEEGVLADAVAREMNALSTAIEEAFDEDDKKSALSKIETTVRDLTDRMARETAKSVETLLDPSEKDSPLSHLKHGVVNEVNASMLQFSQTLGQVHHWLETQAAVAAEAERGTAKGRTYEESVGMVLADISTATGDQVHPTGDETGTVPGSKVGDFIITLGDAGVPARIAVECKNQKLSFKKTAEQLDQAVDNRDAAVGILVFSSEAKTPARGPLVRLGPSRYAVVYDPESADTLALKVAYQLARTDLIAAASADGESQIDPELLAQKVQEARTLLDQVSQIKRGISTARNGLDKAESSLLSMKENLLRTLDELEAAMSSTS